MLDKKFKYLAAALIVFITQCCSAYFTNETIPNILILLSLQMVATGAVIFAIFKRDPLHKDKLFLFWLIISAIQCTVWCFLSFLYLKYGFKYKSLKLVAISTLVFLFLWFIAAVVAFMMYLIYQEYAELTQSNRKRKSDELGELHSVSLKESTNVV